MLTKLLLSKILSAFYLLCIENQYNIGEKHS